MSQRKIFKNTAEVIEDPIFISDAPSADSDELGFKEDATIFAESVCNNNSPESMVFGIDAPWGTGKTTYLEFCKIWWKEKGYLVYEFKPLLYDREDLIPLFLVGLVEFLEKNHFSRDISLLFRKYVKKITAISKFWNIDISDFFESHISDQDLLESLQAKLGESSKQKIIVIVDDLDRLPAIQIKRFLDTIRVGLTLPKISFVVCFDTRNIHAFEQNLLVKKQFTFDEKKEPHLASITQETIDDTKLVEYFEKIVNLKQTLVVEPKRLKDYTEKILFKEVIDEGAIFDPDSKDEIKDALDNFFGPSSFHKYADYIGDLRKIKRLVNIMRLRFRGLRIDISVLDIDMYDLMHLLLIYINFPHVFRKIYTTEIEGKEYFSIEYGYQIGTGSGNGEFKYTNSNSYANYLNTLTHGERFLLGQIFDKERFNENNEDFRKASSSTAAVNGTISRGRNLEGYLRLITKNTTPIKTGEIKFYFKKVKDIVLGTSLDNISGLSEFTFSSERNAERNFTSLFESLVKNIDLIQGADLSKRLIEWTTERLPDFSIVNLEKSGVGLRDNLDLDLVYFLDNRGWIDQDGNHYQNIDTIVVQIADYIFGSKEKVSVIDKVTEEERGILGINDAVRFRLHCVDSRGGGFYNLTRALVQHAKLNGVSVGNEVKDHMRALTQYVYKKFKDRYIETGKNFIAEIYDLDDQNIFGRSYAYLLNQDALQEINIESRKRLISNFLIYQLANNRVNRMDFGFGVFDPTGINDSGLIQNEIRDYLFNKCFSPSETNPRGAEFFVDYLLSEFQDAVSPLVHGRSWVFQVNFITDLLGEDRLKEFWQANGDRIKSDVLKMNKIIDALNYCKPIATT